MPVAGSGHAARISQSSQPPEMESRGATSRLLAAPPPGPEQRLFPRPDTPVTLTGKGAHGPKELDKRSLDYILRSGFAGGLAGCAVRVGEWFHASGDTDLHYRPRQLSGL